MTTVYTGNTFSPTVAKVVKIEGNTVHLYFPTHAPSIRRQTRTLEVFNACYFESVEAMAASYAARGAK